MPTYGNVLNGSEEIPLIKLPSVPLIIDLLVGDFVRLDFRSGNANNLSLVGIAALQQVGQLRLFRQRQAQF